MPAVPFIRSRIFAQRPPGDYPAVRPCPGSLLAPRDFKERAAFAAVVLQISISAKLTLMSFLSFICSGSLFRISEYLLEIYNNPKPLIFFSNEAPEILDLRRLCSSVAPAKGRWSESGLLAG